MNTNKRARSAAYNAIYRCTDINNPGYVYYGGRGISVYPEWLNNPKAFVDYLETLPGWDDKSLMLDRIDNNGNYEPGNLRYVTREESQSNRRGTMSKTPVNFAYLRKLRRLNDITLKVMSSQCGVSTPVICSFEKGKLYGIGENTIQTLLMWYNELERTTTTENLAFLLSDSAVPETKEI